jgi:choline dehydrogenase
MAVAILLSFLTELFRSPVASETAPHAWLFFVEHFANVTQARRDTKYTYTLSNGSYYSGLDPPEDAEP